MKRSVAFMAAMICLLAVSCTSSQSDCSDFGLKPRIVVLTDIAPGDIEPDDMESMIRLMAHADLFEIEALITSGGWNSSGRAYPIGWKDSLSRTINVYEKDLPNLMKRSAQKGFMSLEEELVSQEIGYWPSADYMRSRAMLGSLELGRHKIGAGNRSAGSDHIVALADEDDDRPIWILAWGGANTFAQAIWQVQQERTPQQVKEFLRKFRIYTITDQDVPWGERHSNYPYSSHYEMRRDLSEDLMFFWDESAWLSQNAIGSSNWKEYVEHIQGHGNLGSIYPNYKWGVEGDTPSYLHVLPNGLHDPSVPEMAGWGGYFRWGKGMDDATVKRVFDPFFTEAGKHDKRKVGLGLPILKQICEACDGSLKLETAPGKGTDLTYRFSSSHIDLPPMGDVAKMVVTLFNYPGEFELFFTHKKGVEEYSISRSELAEAVGGLDTVDGIMLAREYLSSQEESLK